MNIRLILSLSLLLGTVNCFASTQISVGDVYDVKTEKLIYREFQTFNKPPSAESLQTEYRSPEGSLIANRYVNLQNGFVSDYRFEQPGLGIKKSVKRNSTYIDYHSQNNAKQDHTRIVLNDKKTTIINAGMFNLIEREWSNLMNGQTISLSLLAPERGRTFDMRIKKQPAKQSNMANYMPADNKVAFKLTIKNPFLRLLLPPIELGYELNTKRLVFYQGPSNLHKTDGEKLGTIRVLYTNT